MTTVWQTKEWKEKSAKIIEEKGACEICGSKEELQVHHPYKETVDGYTFLLKESLKKEYEDSLFDSKDPVIRALWRKHPPNHHSHKSHPYRHSIKQHHSNPTDESDLKYHTTAGFRMEFIPYWWDGFWAWLKVNGKMDFWLGAHDLAVDNYYSMNGVQVLCQHCHYAYTMGKELCSLCKKKFKNRSNLYCIDCSKRIEKENEELEGEMHRQGYN